MVLTWKFHEGNQRMGSDGRVTTGEGFYMTTTEVGDHFVVRYSDLDNGWIGKMRNGKENVQVGKARRTPKAAQSAITKYINAAEYKERCVGAGMV